MVPSTRARSLARASGRGFAREKGDEKEMPDRRIAASPREGFIAAISARRAILFS